MSRPKPPETPEELKAHRKRVDERYVCDCDKTGELRKDIRVLRAAALTLDAWGNDGTASDIEECIEAHVAAVLKERGL